MAAAQYMAFGFAFKYIAFMPCIGCGKMIKMKASDKFHSGILKPLHA